MMIDATTRILLEKHQPNSPLLKESGPTTNVLILMDADDYPISVIEKACNSFNHAHPKLQSHSYMLLHDFHGIAKGSWICLTKTGENQ